MFKVESIVKYLSDFKINIIFELSVKFYIRIIKGSFYIEYFKIEVEKTLIRISRKILGM